jgi:hypothetical protein
MGMLPSYCIPIEKPKKDMSDRERVELFMRNIGRVTLEFRRLTEHFEARGDWKQAQAYKDGASNVNLIYDHGMAGFNRAA